MSKNQGRPSEDDRLPDFLRRLPVSQEIRQRLGELGVGDAATLMGMLRATPTAFQQWLGAGPTRQVAEGLAAMLSPEEERTLATPGPLFAAQGAVVGRPAPASRPFVAALQERDRVHAAWQKEAGPAAVAAPRGGRAQALEEQLEALVELPPAVVSVHSSPVGWLLPYLVIAPFRAAPERAEALRALIREKGIRLRFVDAPDALAAANLKTKEVEFGLAFAERAWAFSYAYLELVRLWQIYGPGSPCEPPSDVRAALEAVHRAEREGGRMEWPKELPRPDPAEGAGTAGFAATELFLTVGAFALLHEIGHILLGHQPDDPPARWAPREYEADDWAADWMLGRWRDYGTGDDERAFVKRSLGGTVCIGHLADLEAHRRSSQVTHPDPARRLLHYLDRNVIASPGPKALRAEMAWMVARLLVAGHLRAVGKALVPGAEHPSPKEFLEAAARVLA